MNLPPCVTLALAFAALFSTGYGQATFNPIGDLTGGGVSSEAIAASDNGAIAVGHSTGPNGGRAVYYTTAGGLVALPHTAATYNDSAQAVTPDGSVIVGWVGTGASLQEAAIWTNGGTVLTNLGTLPGATTPLARLRGTSDDGSIGFGHATDSAGKNQGIRWTAGTGLVGLGFLDPSDTSSQIAPGGVSADGSVAVGTSGSSTVTQKAFTYTLGTGLQSLGLLPGGTWSTATTITSDGSTVFGFANSTAYPAGELYKWTSGAGMVALGAPPGLQPGGFMAATDAGDVVTMRDGSFSSIIYNATGFHSASDVFTDAGLNVTGWGLRVLGVNRDGTMLWGSAMNPSGNLEGWYATFPTGYLAAVPEPSTYAALAGVGVLSLAIWRRRALVRAS